MLFNYHLPLPSVEAGISTAKSPVPSPQKASWRVAPPHAMLGAQKHRPLIIRGFNQDNGRQNCNLRGSDLQQSTPNLHVMRSRMDTQTCRLTHELRSASP